MRYLTINTVITMNQIICRIFNQKSLVLDKGKIQSALSSQDFDYGDSDYEKAAKVFRNLIIAHGFQDGNKRTACIALVYMMKPSCSEKEFEQIALDVATGKYTRDIGDLVYRLYKIK